MKIVVAFLLVVATAYAIPHHAIDEHLFDGLAQELFKVVQSLYSDHRVLTQTQCVNDCVANMGLGTNMCTDVCKVAGTKFHNIQAA